MCSAQLVAANLLDSLGVWRKQHKRSASPAQAQSKSNASAAQAQRKRRTSPVEAQRKSQAEQAQRKCSTRPAQAQRKPSASPAQAEHKQRKPTTSSASPTVAIDRWAQLGCNRSWLVTCLAQQVAVGWWPWTCWAHRVCDMEWLAPSPRTRTPPRQTRR